MICRQFPDNSVVCHARRLAGFYQDVFASGAVLGVFCGDHPLPFFPDVYNEDWFFFGEAAAAHAMPHAGWAYQMPLRALRRRQPAQAHEEFGDLLAEGLYSLIQNQGSGYTFRQTTHRAGGAYWWRFIEARQETLTETRNALSSLLLRDHCSDDVIDALKSFEIAGSRYEDNTSSTPTTASNFLAAWETDTELWRRGSARMNSVGTTRDALASLNIDAEHYEIVR